MNLHKITQEEYNELFNQDMIEGEDIKYGTKINKILNNILSKDSKITRPIDYTKWSKGRVELYDHLEEYVINLDKILNLEPEDIKFLKINFSSPYTEIEDFKKNKSSDLHDDDFISLIVNPLLYRYGTWGITGATKPLSIAHIAKYKTTSLNAKNAEKAIIQLNNYMLDKTGDNLFFKC